MPILYVRNGQSILRKELKSNNIKKEFEPIKALWNFSFVFWFVTEFTITHSMTAQLALALFGAITTLMIIADKKIKMSVIFPLYSLFVIICYLNIALDYSIAPGLSKSLLNTLIKNLIFLVILYHYIAAQNIDDFKKTFIFATTSATVIILIVTYVRTGSFILRGEASLINSNSLAVCSALTVCWIITTEIKLKLSDGLYISILSLFFILSGTRKAIIAFVLGVIVYFCLKHPKRLFRNVIIIAILGGGYFLLIKVPFLYNAMGNRIESFVNLLLGNEGDASAETRRRFIELGIRHFKQRPMIGFGINTFQTLPGAYGTYSHNNYVELLFSVGLIGTVTYYLMHGFALLRSIKQYFIKRTNNIIITITFIVILIVIDVGMVSYYSRSSLMFIVICYTLSERIKSKDENNKIT